VLRFSEAVDARDLSASSQRAYGVAMSMTLEVVDGSLQQQAELYSATNGRADQAHARNSSPPAAVEKAALAAQDPVLAGLRAMYARLKAKPVPDRLQQLIALLD
jgi:hypothetical protein